MKVRHEINILDAILTSTTADITSSEQKPYDPTYYNGTVTAYLEVLFTNSHTAARSAVLVDTSGITIDTLSLPANTANYTLARSAALSPTELKYVSVKIVGGSGTVNIKAARIVIIQDTGSEPIKCSASQFEFGNKETGKTATTANPLAQVKYWAYLDSRWDGSLSFLADGVFRISDSMYTMTAYIQEDDGNYLNWTNKATIMNASSATSASYNRVVFTPTTGRHYRVAMFATNTMATHEIHGASIMVRQLSGAFLESNTGTSTSNALQGDSGGVTVGQRGVKFRLAANETVTGIKLKLKKTGTPTDNYTVSIYSALNGGSLLGSGTFAASTATGTMAVYNISFSAGIALTAGTDYFIRVTRGIYDTSNYLSMEGITPIMTFPNHAALNYSSGTWGESASMYYFELMGMTTGISKMQEEYLLANTSISAGTALQACLTKWDSTEWSGVDNTYRLGGDYLDQSVSIMLLRTAADGAITNATLTRIYNQSASTLIDSEYPSPNSSGSAQLFGTTTAVGQSFQSVGGVLDQVEFYYGKTGTPTGTVKAKLYAHSGTLGTSSVPTGIALAESVAEDLANIGAQRYRRFRFEGANRITLTASTNYVVVIEFTPTTSDASNYVSVAQDTTSPTHAGNAASYNGAWAAQSTIDLVFAVHLDMGATMPASTNLDFKATNNNGAWAARLMVDVVKTSVPVTTTPRYFGYLIGV